MEINRENEIQAANKLQRAVKAYIGFKKMKLLKDITLEIQKNLKGFFERENFAVIKNKINSDMNSNFYNYHVEKIQFQ